LTFINTTGLRKFHGVSIRINTTWLKKINKIKKIKKIREIK